MSTPVDNFLTSLKASTAQIIAIISSTQQIPLGNSHFSLTTQAQVIKDYQTGPLPGIMLLCSKELLCVWGMTPQVWPNWHSIRYDDPCLLKHVWCPKLLTWEALGDHTFDLPVATPPSTGLIPVDLPSPPICTSNVAGSSTSTTTKFWDKGKGRRESEEEVSHDFSTLLLTPKPLVDSEDEEDMSIQPFLGGVPDVVLPQLSNSPRSPQVSTKKPFGPATVIAGSHPAVIEPSQPTPKSPVEAPPVIDGGDILIPRPNNPCQVCTKLNWDCATRLDKRTGNPSLPSASLAIPAPAPGPAVPAAALNLPMPDLHAMTIAIWDGTACITILNAHVAEQDGKIDTLQCLHEDLRHEIINWHSAFPILKSLANATSLLLDQSVPPSMSPSASALPPLINLSIGEMMPTPLKFKDASAIEGLLFEYNQVVQPEVPDMYSEIVDLGDPGNLVPEYGSSDDMDVEVKVEASSEEVDRAT
ncbi:uncharacterized protein BJ212DRAFT_1480140 [Suillus subaureus]|uniref:Uncharacterized protein n=1 Tax=Suillus subaureus TaxID=48587 RepID=A0A9P7ECR4_9AGAM|nr:uncharacterized protein BJ212DRAFT_1480140 [Suillus subaureus]KAG1817571.1 hypothetical protein BJ212DRAFT_1480140 [Suillus subaureus]